MSQTISTAQLVDDVAARTGLVHNQATFSGMSRIRPLHYMSDCAGSCPKTLVGSALDHILVLGEALCWLHATSGRSIRLDLAPC